MKNKILLCLFILVLTQPGFSSTHTINDIESFQVKSRTVSWKEIDTFIMNDSLSSKLDRIHHVILSNGEVFYADDINSFKLMSKTNLGNGGVVR